jgi:hypothetical protein
MKETITVEESLKAVSDNKALTLFEIIAHQKLDTQNVLTKLGLTKRQYYSRLLSLFHAGLIKRKNGTYSMTSFGKVVYKAQTLVGQGISNYWKLKAIDSLEFNSPVIVREEFLKIMNLIIDNQELREILVLISKDGNNKMITQSEVKIAPNEHSGLVTPVGKAIESANGHAKSISKII